MSSYLDRNFLMAQNGKIAIYLIIFVLFNCLFVGILMNIEIAEKAASMVAGSVSIIATILK
jgi:hypothetical protein